MANLLDVLLEDGEPRIHLDGTRVELPTPTPRFWEGQAVSDPRGVETLFFGKGQSGLCTINSPTRIPALRASNAPARVKPKRKIVEFDCSNRHGSASVERPKNVFISSSPKDLVFSNRVAVNYKYTALVTRPMAETRSLIDILIATGAVRYGEFVLKSGLATDYYVDIKRACTNPAALRLIAARMAPLAEGCDLIAGMELGAVPIATAVSLQTDLPFLVVRKSSKEHGTRSRIEGLYEPGQRVMVVEDVTTTGGSSLEAAKVLSEAGLRVTRVVTCVDRGENTARAFDEAKVAFESLLDAKALLARKPRPGSL